MLILLILEDKHKIFSPVPFAVVTLETPGIFLYPNPPEVKLILLIPPETVNDEVLYVIVDAAPAEYDPCSGTSLSDILNPPVVTPKATYFPLYSLST